MHSSPSRGDSPTLQQSWKELSLLLAPYRQSSLPVALWQLGSTLVVFLALWVLMWYSLRWSYAVSLLVAIPTGGCLIRLFVLQHDCGHGSYFQSRWLNHLVGCSLSLLTLTPYYRWRKGHAVHHATSGDLDRRGLGDVWMLTVDEYQKLSPWWQLCYRFIRHPLILFGIGPLLYFTIYQRFAWAEPHTWRRERSNVRWTNAAILLAYAVLGWWIGYGTFLMLHLPVLAISSSGGAWLFYVQHHYEQTYWERTDHWNYVDAGLVGSSYFELPRLLQWFTGNIGFHHIHHLDARIPNYQLERCYREVPAMQHVHKLNLWTSLSCASLALWDEKQSRMVGYPRNLS